MNARSGDEWNDLERGLRWPAPDAEAQLLAGGLHALPSWSAKSLDVEGLQSAWRRALRHRGAAGCPQTVSVYVHFPYCQTSCRFCMYHHSANRNTDVHGAYVDYLMGLVQRYRVPNGPTGVTYAYFGGGTPSLHTASQIDAFLTAFTGVFRVERAFTFEANPLSMSAEKLRILRRHGVNRVSMGVQAFDRNTLKRIGRLNGPIENTHDLVRQAVAMGFEVNVDIILGLPGHTQSMFQEGLLQAMDLGADTVTIYRYQPTARMAEAGSLTFRDAFAGVRRRILRRGWVASIPRDPNAYGAKVARAHVLLRWARGRMRTMWAGERGEYHCFADGQSQLLGLGPGAWSHLYGHAWYRDVTDLGELAGGPRYVGTRFSPEDEAKIALIRGLRGGGAKLREIRRRTGVDPRPLLQHLDVRYGVRYASVADGADLSSLLPNRDD